MPPLLAEVFMDGRNKSDHGGKKGAPFGRDWLNVDRLRGVDSLWLNVPILFQTVSRLGMGGRSQMILTSGQEAGRSF